LNCSVDDILVLAWNKLSVLDTISRRDRHGLYAALVERNRVTKSYVTSHLVFSKAVGKISSLLLADVYLPFSTPAPGEAAMLSLMLHTRIYNNKCLTYANNNSIIVSMLLEIRGAREVVIKKRKSRRNRRGSIEGCRCWRSFLTLRWWVVVVEIRVGRVFFAWIRIRAIRHPYSPA